MIDHQFGKLAMAEFTCILQAKIPIACASGNHKFGDIELVAHAGIVKAVIKHAMCI